MGFLALTPDLGPRAPIYLKQVAFNYCFDMRALAACLFLLPTAPAIAGGPDLSYLGSPAYFDLTVHGTAYEAHVPPEFWFDEPLSYEPEIIILPEHMITAMCTELVGFVEKVGCNANLGDAGQIYVVDTLSDDDLEEVIITSGPTFWGGLAITLIFKAEPVQRHR